MRRELGLATHSWLHPLSQREHEGSARGQNSLAFLASCVLAPLTQDMSPNTRSAPISTFSAAREADHRPVCIPTPNPQKKGAKEQNGIIPQRQTVREAARAHMKISYGEGERCRGVVLTE